MNGYYTAAEVSAAISKIENELKKYYIVTDDIDVARFASEEIILNYTLEQGCERFRFRCRKKSGKVHLVMEFFCPSFDVLAPGNDLIVTNLLKNVPLQCDWQYKNGRNIISFQFEAIRTHLQNLLFVLRFIKEEKLRFAAALVMQSLSVFLCVAFPILTARITEGFALEALESVVVTVAVLMVARAANDVLTYCFNVLYNVIYNSVMNTIELNAARQVMNMEMRCIEDHGSGMFIQRLTTDANQIAMGFDTFSVYLYEMIQYLGILAAILYLHPTLFLLKILCLAPLIYIEIVRTERRTAGRRSYLMLNDEFTGVVGEMTRGSRDVKLLNCGGVFLDDLSRTMKSTNASRSAFLNQSNRYDLAGCVLARVFEFIFCFLLVIFIIKGSVTPIVAVILFNYSINLLPAPKFAGSFLEYIKAVSLSSERLYQLVNNREFVREEFGTRHLDNFKGEIEFRQVSYSYEKRPYLRRQRHVLDKMDLTIHAGETVAFVGKSGCGKSTALNIIARLLQADSGQVLLDGVDIRELDKETIRSNITAISQSPYIFKMSIRENLLLVKPDATEEETISACKRACLHEEIMSMPDGYDTVVGEGGLGLSGGQRQRLAIARGLLNDSRIIMLDEATSALDNLTQKKIKDTITGLHGSRTVIIVAHRLSTIQNCDRIYYFSEGKVLAEGTHEQLLESCEEYRTLWNM